MNLNDLARVWVVIKPSIEDGDIHEAADVLYHLFVYLERNEVKIEDVMHELEKRKK